MIHFSDTRWVCRYKNCDVVLKNFAAILQVLNEEIEANSDRNVSQAIGIYLTIKKGSFVVNLFIFHNVLIVINVLSNKLQQKTATLGNTASVIKAVIETFEENRSDDSFLVLWRKIKEFVDNHDISLEVPLKNSKRIRKEPRGLKEFVVTATTSSEKENVDDSDSFKIEIDSLKAEMTVAKNSLKKFKNEFDLENLKSAIEKHVFPNIYTLLQVALTLPISSATCERSFSALKRLKTWLRVSMGQERLTDLAILYIDKDLTTSINRNAVIDHFAKSERRIPLQ